MERSDEKLTASKDLTPQPLSNRSTNLSIASEKVYYVNPRHRWYMVTLAIIAIFSTGPVYMNWPPLYRIFMHEGAYADACNPGEPPTEGGICREQELSVDFLSSFPVSNMFAFSLIAGILLDSLGAKLCSLVGFASQVIGWIIFALSKKLGWYLAGMFFVSAGQDASYFGMLSIAHMFPSHIGTFMAIFGAARSLSFAVPIVMEPAALALSFTAVASGYAVFLVAWMVIFFFFLPYAPYPKLPKESFSSDNRNPPLLEELKKPPTLSWEGTKTATVTQVKEVLKYAFSWGYLVLLPLPTVTLIRSNYYNMGFLRMVPSAVDYLTVMNPLSVLPCPFFGYLADIWAASLVSALLAALGALSLLMTMFGNAGLEYTSVTIQWLFVSFMASQYYVYVTAVYPQKQMGKLVGFALMVGGLLSNLARVLHEAAVNGERLAMDLVVMALGVTACCLAVTLYFFVERPSQRLRKAQLKQSPPDVPTGVYADIADPVKPGPDSI